MDHFRIFAEENNNHLFRSMNLHQVDDKVLIGVTYYLLVDGVIYYMNKDGTRTLSGDNISDLLTLENLGGIKSAAIRHVDSQYITNESLIKLISGES